MSASNEDVGDFSPRYWFRDWPNDQIPRVAVGVYAIWHGDMLIYCGMSGKEAERKAEEARRQNKRFGLVLRLDAHRQGRLSGDQFCVYVANRVVIPRITDEQKQQFEDGTLRLDQLTKEWINTNYEYQYLLVDTDTKAYELEERMRDGSIFTSKPLLNPR